MADQWHYAVNGKQMGPVPVETLSALAQTGGVMPQDLVWKEGFETWVPAGGIPELFPQAATAAPLPQDQPAVVAGAYLPPTANLNYYNPAPAGAVQAYAGFWLRFVAYIIDALLIQAVQFPASLLTTSFSGSSRMVPKGSLLPLASLNSGIGLTFFLLTWLYFALMESSPKRGTLGKMAMGIMVTDMNGNTLTFGKATGRYFAKMLSSLTLGIGYIMAGFTDRRQALHDIVASCLVVRKQLPRQG